MTDNQKLLPFAALFGLMMLLGGVLFLLDGGWKAYQQNRHRGWPVVEARVEDCSISRVWRRQGKVGSSHLGTDTMIHCRLTYQADGMAREVTAPVGVSIFTSPGMWQYPAPTITQATQASWVQRHLAGSTLPIHVDPSDPAGISLIGVDDELQPDSPPQFLWFGALLTVVGLAIFGAVRRRVKKAIRAASPSQPEGLAAGNPPR